MNQAINDRLIKAQLKQLIQNSFKQILTNRILQDYCQVEFKNKEKKYQFIEIRKLNSIYELAF